MIVKNLSGYIVAIIAAFILCIGLAVGPMHVISRHTQILIVMAGFLIWHLDILLINPITRLYLCIQKIRHGG